MSTPTNFEEIFAGTPFSSFEDIIEKTKNGEIIDFRLNIFTRSVLYNAATILDKKTFFLFYLPQVFSLISLIYLAFHYNSWWILIFWILSFLITGIANFLNKAVWFIGIFAILGFTYFTPTALAIILISIAFTILFSYIGYSIWLNKSVKVILKNILLDEELLIYLFKNTAIFIYTSDGNYYTGKGLFDRIHKNMGIEEEQ